MRFPAGDVDFPLMRRASYSVGAGGLFPCSEAPGEGCIPVRTFTIKALHLITCLEGKGREKRYTDLGPMHTASGFFSVTLPSEWYVFTVTAVFIHLPEQHVIGGL